MLRGRIDKVLWQQAWCQPQPSSPLISSLGSLLHGHRISPSYVQNLSGWLQDTVMYLVEAGEMSLWTVAGLETTCPAEGEQPHEAKQSSRQQQAAAGSCRGK